MEYMKKRLEELTGGKASLDLYSGGVLGGEIDCLEQVQKGELASVLGVTPKEVAQPTLTVTPAARAQLEAALEGEGGTTLRFSIDKRFQYGLEVDGPQPGDFSYPLGKVTLLLDRGSAKRAEGVVIDFVDRGHTSGFKIDNPSAPPTVKPLSPRELKAKLDASEKLELFDVRTVEERQLAAIGGARLLDAHVDAHIRTLPKDATPALRSSCNRGAA
jgi:monothiol glutaredoxin